MRILSIICILGSIYNMTICFIMNAKNRESLYMLKLIPLMIVLAQLTLALATCGVLIIK